MFEDLKAVLTVVLCISLTLFFMLKPFFKALKERKQSLRELENNGEIPLVFEDAAVISKKTDIYYNKNIKLPDHKFKFYVKFSVGGEEKTFEVTEDVFSALNENQKGVLVTRNGRFYDFS